METKLKIDTLSDEENHELYDKWRKNLRPCDDELMSKVFLHRECVECVLKPILKLTDLEIVKVRTQRPVPGIEPDARGVRFDVLAWDKNGCPYNIEIQRDRRGMSIKRTRIYGGAVDLLAAEKGTDFAELPDTYVIFICGFDMFKRGLPIYTTGTFIKETGEIVDDGRHVTYLNAPMLMKNPATELGRLMCDLWCADPRKMYHRELADVVKYYKEGKGGEMELTGFMADLVAYKEAKAEARAKFGTLKQVLENMMSLHKYSADKAMDEMGLNSEDRQELKKLLLQESEE